MKNELRIAACCETWAIWHPWLVSALEAAGITATVAARPQKLPTAVGNVAVLPLHGMITQRGSVWDGLFCGLFGGTSTERFGAAFTRAVNDDRVGAVVIDIDSPGGTTYGVQELADRISEGASRKPVYAVANGLAASAAFWLGSQAGAGRFVASPSADVGSIGVYRMLEDVSGAMQQAGIRTELLAVPPEKVEDFGTGPLSDEARAHHLEQVAISYDAFTSAVARGRGVKQQHVKAGYGKGRVFKAPQALEMGLVDRIATRGEVLGELTRGGRSEVSVGATAAIVADLCHAWETCECEPLSRGPSVDTRRRRAYLLDK